MWRRLCLGRHSSAKQPFGGSIRNFVLRDGRSSRSLFGGSTTSRNGQDDLRGSRVDILDAHAGQVERDLVLLVVLGNVHGGSIRQLRLGVTTIGTATPGNIDRRDAPFRSDFLDGQGQIANGKLESSHRKTSGKNDKSHLSGIKVPDRFHGSVTLTAMFFNGMSSIAIIVPNRGRHFHDIIFGIS